MYRVLGLISSESTDLEQKNLLLLLYSDARLEIFMAVKIQAILHNDVVG